jgi:hypothetical protein
MVLRFPLARPLPIAARRNGPVARPRLWGLVVTLLAASALLVTSTHAQAQGDTEQPAPADPRRTIPEKMEPEALLPRNEPLSDRLGRDDGVIAPPPDVDPKMNVPAPAPDPGTTPVIPPPGSPGNPSPVRPK